jgi:Leucine-rich repeat (LRR) protein
MEWKNECQMKYKFLYIIGLVGMVSALAGCSDENTETLKSLVNTDQTNQSVIKLTTTREDGKISLSVDALAANRTGVWIDLNGDGIRAADGSEDVKSYNAYTDYQLPAGIREITIHGDITYLGCASDQLSNVDVTDNPYLTTFNCPQNELTGIDVSKNTALQRFDCSGNKIKTLDVSANTALVSLWCYSNQLTSLDVSANTDLAALDCSGNQLTMLDVSRISHWNV